MTNVFLQLEQFLKYELEQDSLVSSDSFFQCFITQTLFCIYLCILTVANFLSLVMLFHGKAQRFAKKEQT